MPRHGPSVDGEPEPAPPPPGLNSAFFPADLRQSLAELKQPGGARRVCSWLAVTAAHALAGTALYLAMDELFFGQLLFGQLLFSECSIDAVSETERDIDDFFGAFPALVRGLLLTEVGTAACRKIVGLPARAGLVRGLLTGVGDGDGDARPAGWMAIVGSRSGEASTEPQSTWEQVREARDLPWRQAIASAVTKLLLWHWSQPVVYLWMLAVYRCFVASLGSWQQRFASIVAAREVLYLCSTLLATWQCPVFLLMDPSTAWGEADTRLEKVQRPSKTSTIYSRVVVWMYCVCVLGRLVSHNSLDSSSCGLGRELPPFAPRWL